MVSSDSALACQTPEKTWNTFSNIYRKYLNNSKKNLLGNKAQRGKRSKPTGR
jgi:hypothetical protein